MNKFKLNKNSWHYKLAVKTVGSGYWLRKYNKDFCSYWRVVTLGAIGFLSGVSLILFFLGVYIYLWIFELKVMLFVHAIILSGFLLFYLSKKLSKSDKEPGFIKTKYLSWKQKYCPLVDYGDE